MRQRGCNKPGHSYQQEGTPFFFTSPMLQGEDDRVVRECPVGKVLRESPQTYSVIDAVGVSENASPVELARMPRFYVQMARLFRSETERNRELQQRDEQAKADAKYASRVRASW